MKRVYVKPEFYCEEFLASEYVAACWNIKCNVPMGYGYYDKNGNGRYDERIDEYINRGYGCGTTHEAYGIDAEGPSANAMWHDDRANKDYAVFYFHAKADKYWDKNDHFCTLDSVNWEKNPNASN